MINQQHKETKRPWLGVRTAGSLDGCFSVSGQGYWVQKCQGKWQYDWSYLIYTHFGGEYSAESHLWHFHLEVVSFELYLEIAVSKIISLLPILNQIFKHMCLHTHTHTGTRFLMSTQKYRAEGGTSGKCSNRCRNPQCFPGSLKLALILIVH